MPARNTRQIRVIDGRERMIATDTALAFLLHYEFAPDDTERSATSALAGEWAVLPMAARATVPNTGFITYARLEALPFEYAGQRFRHISEAMDFAVEVYREFEGDDEP